MLDIFYKKIYPNIAENFPKCICAAWIMCVCLFVLNRKCREEENLNDEKVIIVKIATKVIL